MKKDFSIRPIEKKTAKFLLERHHYLSNISKGFKSGWNYGLFKYDPIPGYNIPLLEEKFSGVCIFTGLPVPELMSGMLGMERTENQDGILELSRLCVDPSVQDEEHNITSWFVSRAIKELRKTVNVRAILSYADTDFHKGTIYRACNFAYYGMTDPKSDFWIKQEDGSFVKHSRGKMKGLEGEWRPRSRKHRFLMVFDKDLRVKWNKEDYSKYTKNSVDASTD